MVTGDREEVMISVEDCDEVTTIRRSLILNTKCPHALTPGLCDVSVC